MTSEVLTLPYYVEEEDKSVIQVEHDGYTRDQDVKFKSRSMNLIKHNPNLFTNKESGSFTQIIGGARAFGTILLFGGLSFFYRFQANKLRHLSTRESIWFLNAYFWYGCGIGALYSGLYFWNWQRHFNDTCAHYLFKRYPASANLKRSNIYAIKDVENEDECYRFTSTYANSFHL